MMRRVGSWQWAGLLVGLLVGLACAAPARPASSDAATVPRAPAPAAEPNAWERLVAAARQEGKLVIAAPANRAARDAVMEFQKAYPDILVEYLGLRGADFFPRLVAERQADQYFFDVHIGGAGTPAQDMKPLGFLDPLDPELLLPDLADEKTWLGGFREAFYDRDRTHVFGFQASLWYQVFVNRDQVPVAELSHVRDLVLPRWSGRIVSDGVSSFGGGCGVGAHWLMVLGEESFRQL
jgi:hypothetical protein